MELPPEDEERQEEEVPETPVPIVLRHCTVVIEDTKELDVEYPVGLFEFAAGETSVSIAVILISQVEGRLVCAFPASSWHRVVSKRILPTGSLLKPVSLQVEFIDRDPPVGFEDSVIPSQRVWLGLLPVEFEDYVTFDSSVEQVEPEYPFDSRSPAVLPTAESLAAAFEQHFAFTSATSGAEPRRRGRKPDLDSRLSLLETSFAELATDVKKALSGVRQPAIKKAEPTARASFGQPCPPPGLVAAGDNYGGADFEVVSAARNAGIPEAQIQEMVRLAMKGKPNLNDLPRPRAAPKPSNGLSDSEDEVNEQGGAFHLEPDDVPPDRQISTALSKLTEIAGHLTAQRKKAQTLDALLEGSGSLGGTENSSVGTSRKNAAALRALRRMLSRNPSEITKVMERNMEEDFALRTQLPGASTVPPSARAWLELRSRVQGYQTPLRLLWSIKGALDSLRAGAPEEAKARLYLALAMGDQLSIDRGQWVLAGEISLEDPPPISVFSSHTLPTELEAPYSRLLDARWVDLFLHKLHDYDLLNEKKKKLTFRKRGEDDSSAPSTSVPDPKKPPKKGGGKGKDGKGKRESGGGGSADPPPVQA